MADHVSSIYSAIEDVPIIASPQYRVPKQVSLPYDFAIIPDDVSNIQSNPQLQDSPWSWPSKIDTAAIFPSPFKLQLKYDFQTERYVLTEITQQRQRQADQAKILAEQQRSYEEAKRQKEKQKARKIAPGFLDTDRRILTPEPVIRSPRKVEWPTLEGEDNDGKSDVDSEKNGSPKQNGSVVHSRSASEDLTERRRREDRVDGVDGVKPALSNSSKTGKNLSQFNFSEFEQGLPPPDPWDAPENDFAALRDVLGLGDSVGGGNSSAPSSPPSGLSRSRIVPPTFQQPGMPPPNQPQQAFSSNYIPTNPNNISGTSPSPILRNALQPSISTPLSTSPRQYYLATDNGLPNQPPLTSYSTGTPPPPQHKYPPRPVEPSRSTSPVPPARPPKYYAGASTPSPAGSPALASAALPIFTEPAQYRALAGTPPPLPPLPSQATEGDIQLGDKHQVAELMNMGFSRQQAVDALEKNDYDLSKATNFLLDWGML
ncbi:LOW QUALITY PROTEIN: hypothetical protein BC937DRAFT_90350 [Endogone sp. FLAS-F59071]|nr:LOW QUALITY PROTEIN: hypothetical protein BC937DRAFT_90350 [Endogone sp. FLAS-F59071]|eukprot:RUS23231.1 LOW QUALITY PROTEIN: hypothetical protein BC937DRAFT_90350 [Endogone sp. FLAS-F59071]